MTMRYNHQTVLLCTNMLQHHTHTHTHPHIVADELVNAVTGILQNIDQITVSRMKRSLVTARHRPEIS